MAQKSFQLRLDQRTHDMLRIVSGFTHQGNMSALAEEILRGELKNRIIENRQQLDEFVKVQVDGQR
ncbi:MAG: hypothetical protein ACPGQQ_03535 [Candidatus Puniceispirillaceae bacterium]